MMAGYAKNGDLLHSGNVDWDSHYGEQYKGSLRNWEMKPRNPSPGYLPKVDEINTLEVCKIIIIYIVLLMIAKLWNWTWCLVTEDWIRKSGIYSKWNTTIQT
jgi:hypothetical protein